MSTSGSRKNNRRCLYNIDFSNAGFTNWFSSRGCPVGQAYKQGYERGCRSGYAQGYKRGKSERNDQLINRDRNDQLTNRERTQAYNQGYKNGYKQGTRDGYSRGKKQGYSEGFQDGTAQGFGAGYEAALREGSGRCNNNYSQGSSFDGMNVRVNEEPSDFNSYGSRGEEFYSPEDRNEWNNNSLEEGSRWSNNSGSEEGNRWSNNSRSEERNDWSSNYRSEEGNGWCNIDRCEGRESSGDQFGTSSEYPRNNEFNNFMSDL